MTNKTNTKIDLPRLIIRIADKVIHEIKKALLKPEDKHEKNPH